MNSICSERRVSIVNPQGLHARPADMFVRLANRFSSDVQVVKGNERVDGKSILSILTLAAVQGTELTIAARGSDAQAATDALADLIVTGFDEQMETAFEQPVENQQATPDPQNR